MKRYILLNLLIVMAACPAIAIPTIAYKSTSAEVNNVLDDLWWEGKSTFKIEWDRQTADSMIYNQPSIDGEIVGTSLVASIDNLEFDNSANPNSQNKNDFQFNGRSRDSYIKSKSSNFETDPDLLNPTTINASPPWATRNGHGHAYARGLGHVSHSPPVAPAPGAILLGSTGMAFVGWLHRRKKI